MTLDPAVQEFLSTKLDAGLVSDPVASRRAAILAGSDDLFDMFGQPGPDWTTSDEHAIPTSEGSIRVRVYREEPVSAMPVHVFLHGGGFWLGSIDERVVDATCRERSAGARIIVVAVDYRLAPEHPFPRAVEDCIAAVLWVHEHAASFGGDPSNISIGGVSAGGNLAAAVALALRDRPGPRLRLQLLEVPVLDLTLETMRRSGIGDDFGITLREMSASAEMYLAGHEARDPLASPLLAADVRGLPAAQILTAEYDPLREDGERYAARLRDAGIAVYHRRHLGAVHGSLALTGTWLPAQKWRSDVIKALVSAHWLDRPGGSPSTVANTYANAHRPVRGTSVPRHPH